MAVIIKRKRNSTVRVLRGSFSFWRELIAIELTVGVISAIFGIVIGYLGFTRNRDKDVRSDAEESAVVRTKLDSIGQGVDSIRVDLKVHERRMTDLSEKVIRVEESTKQAHKRIDSISKER